MCDQFGENLKNMGKKKILKFFWVQWLFVPQNSCLLCSNIVLLSSNYIYADNHWSSFSNQNTMSSLACKQVVWIDGSHPRNMGNEFLFCKQANETTMSKDFQHNNTNLRHIYSLFVSFAKIGSLNIYIENHYLDMETLQNY